MNTAASNPARAWPTAWGKEARQWCEKHLRNGDFKGRLEFMRSCMSATNGMLNPKVPSDVWDEKHA